MCITILKHSDWPVDNMCLKGLYFNLTQKNILSAMYPQAFIKLLDRFFLSKVLVLKVNSRLYHLYTAPTTTINIFK